MHLTKHTDYGLRALIYLMLHPGRPVSTTEIAEVFDVPQSHLTKVINHLAGAGFVRTQRGKGGGSTLALSPEEIHIGAVVRELEEDLSIVSCERPQCPARRACDLRSLVHQAVGAFLEVLDEYTLNDVVAHRQRELHTLLKSSAVADD